MAVVVNYLLMDLHLQMVLLVLALHHFPQLIIIHKEKGEQQIIVVQGPVVLVDQDNHMIHILDLVHLYKVVLAVAAAVADTAHALQA